MKYKILNGWLVVVAAFVIAANSLAQPVAPTSNTERRIQLLEAAIYPRTPDEVAKLFAKAVMERNGALQFMLLAPALQQEKRPQFEASKWVTGASSPQVINYGVVNTERSTSVWKYTVYFTLQYQGGKPYTCINHMEVGQSAKPTLGKQPVWAITQLELFDPVTACGLPRKAKSSEE